MKPPKKGPFKNTLECSCGQAYTKELLRAARITLMGYIDHAGKKLRCMSCKKKDFQFGLSDEVLADDPDTEEEN